MQSHISVVISHVTRRPNPFTNAPSLESKLLSRIFRFSTCFERTPPRHHLRSSSSASRMLTDPVDANGSEAHDEWSQVGCFGAGLGSPKMPSLFLAWPICLNFWWIFSIFVRREIRCCLCFWNMNAIWLVLYWCSDVNGSG